MNGIGSCSGRLRLAEFLAENRIALDVVEQFDEYAVDVALPAEWEPIQSPPGTRVCFWRSEPCRARFCANVVLTLNQIEAVLDPAEVFSMLCESQADLVPGTEENSRDLSRAMEAPGVVGKLALHIPSDAGLLASESVTRILATQRHTLIAQLTLTALPESPVDRNNIGLAVTHVALRFAGQSDDPASVNRTAAIRP